MRPFLAVVLLAALAPAAPVPKTLKKRDDASLIVGRWKPVSGYKQWYEFKDDGTLRTWDTGSEKPAAYRWTVNPAASPKRITWLGVESGSPEWEGIYELDGDTLKVAYCRGPKVPEGFSPGQHEVLLEQVRDVPAK